MGPAPSDTANSRSKLYALSMTVFISLAQVIRIVLCDLAGPSMFGIPVPPALQLHQRIVGFGSEIKSGKALAIALHWIQRDDVKSNALDFVLHSSEVRKGVDSSLSVPTCK